MVQIPVGPMLAKRIILTTFGSFGDIHPFMAIAMELQARGHRPLIASSELYREKTTGAGLEFTPVRPNLPPPREQDQELMDRVMEPRSGPNYLVGELILPHLRDSYSDLLEIVEDADLLVTHPITFAGPLVARKKMLPWVSVVLSPASFMSAYDAPVPPFWSWLGKFSLLGPRFMRPAIKAMKQVTRRAT